MTTTTKTTSPPKHYDFLDLEKLWVKKGGSTYLAPVMAAIALAESNGDPNATHKNKDGSIDRGLWQINSSHGKGTSSLNPENNAEQAVGVYHSQGLTAWHTFTNGAYLIPLKKYGGKNMDVHAADRFLKKHPTSKGLDKASTDWLTAAGHSAGVGSGVGLKSKTEGSLGLPSVNSIEDAIMLGLHEGMYAMAILGGGMLILLGLLFIGVDLGLSGLSSRASAHPAVKLVNVGTTKLARGGGGTETIPDTSGSLPGPEA